MNRSARASEETDGDIYLRPLFLCRVHAGMPSPTDDYFEERLNLNRFIFRNPSATTLHQVRGDSLEPFGVFRGDLLVIDKSLPPGDRKLVLVEVKGEKAILLIVRRQETLFIVTGGDSESCEELCGEAIKLLGVVTYSIHTPT